MGYLDNSGLSYLWGKIKTALGGKQDKESSVSVPGSGALSMSETLGSGPYTIEFTEEAGSGGGSLPDGSAGQILGYVEDNVVGPIMSKSDLLSAETAALFPGLPENPMPNDVFGKIGTFMDENTYLEKVNEFEATEDSDVFAFAVTENDLRETFIASISGISGNASSVKLSSPHSSSRRYSKIQAGSDYIFNSTTTSIVIDQQHPSFFVFRFSGTVSGSNAVGVQIIVHDINGLQFFNCTGNSDNYKTAIFSIDLNIGQSLKIYRVVK